MTWTRKAAREYLYKICELGISDHHQPVNLHMLQGGRITNSAAIIAQWKQFFLKHGRSPDKGDEESHVQWKLLKTDNIIHQGEATEMQIRIVNIYLNGKL